MNRLPSFLLGVLREGQKELPGSARKPAFPSVSQAAGTPSHCWPEAQTKAQHRNTLGPGNPTPTFKRRRTRELRCVRSAVFRTLPSGPCALSSGHSPVTTNTRVVGSSRCTLPRDGNEWCPLQAPVCQMLTNTKLGCKKPDTKGGSPSLPRRVPAPARNWSKLPGRLLFVRIERGGGARKVLRGVGCV